MSSPERPPTAESSPSDWLAENVDGVIPPGYELHHEPVPPWRRGWRFQAIFWGAVAPIICFVAAIPAGGSWNGGPAWQSGQLVDYVRLLTAWPAAAAFYPLLLYSITSVALILYDYGRFSRYFALRLGVYTGVILAVQYFGIVNFRGDSIWSLAVTLPLMMGTSAIVYICVWGVAAAIVTIYGAFGFKRFVGLAVAFGLSMAVLAFADQPKPRPGASIIMVFLLFIMWVITQAFSISFYLCLFLGAPSALVVFAGTSIFLWRNAGEPRWRFSLARLLGVFTWIAAYFGAWRYSLNLMLIEYAKLPTEDPNCYVCTAAARGHERLVRSRPVAGAAFQANDQMRTLKAAELVIQHVTPRAHRIIRRIYNRLGPPLARRLRHPLAADLAYLSLKPAEWLARAVLRLLLPDRASTVWHLYRR